MDLARIFSRVDQTTHFNLKSNYQPSGDQPAAIAKLVRNISEGISRQVLLGVTGSGKTFTMANVINTLNRPALILAHNKTLAAQLYSEFKELFPENAVRYFVSYYDYYQPEAYIPSTDTYIEKDAAINDEIDKLRHAATKALLERRDVVVVASVSCIYGLGDPEKYFEMMLYLEVGDEWDRDDILRKLVELQYSREDIEFAPSSFRVRGDLVEVCPASDSECSVRLELFGSEVEAIYEFDRLSGKVLRKLNSVCIYPASHFVTPRADIERALITIKAELEGRLADLNKQGKTLEAKRLEQRTLYDLELLDETGFCSGIENYSRHLTGRAPGEPPPSLIDYFPPDTLVFIDESHVTVPQLVGMFRGDRSRKQTLVDFGFRLPSALDNRPLCFDEFDNRTHTKIYVSATPSKFEIEDSQSCLVEQIIRPTGLVDPLLEVRPASTQVEDFLSEVREVIARDERAMVTTLTKRMSEHLSEYYRKIGLKVRYLHSEIHTLERIELIRGLQLGEFDLLIGVNLLREGLDLPEVSLIGIMDADKEGFLRSTTSLIQTIGRAARNLNGHVIMYGDKVTDSMQRAIEETNRRRDLQQAFNDENGIIPKSVRRSVQSAVVEFSTIAEGVIPYLAGKQIPKNQKAGMEEIARLRKQMFEYASKFEFEKAAEIRDQIAALERLLLTL